MRTFHNLIKSFDKKFFILSLIAIICGTMCGIIVSLSTSIGNYLGKYATYYVKYIYKFNNEALLFPYLGHTLLFCFIFWVFSFLKPAKILSFIVFLVRSFFFGVYLILLITYGDVGGVIVILLVFVPMSVISILCCFICLNSKCFHLQKLSFLLPLCLSLAAFLIFVLLLNVIFRFVVVIV
jgi:hypothetical protein